MAPAPFSTLPGDQLPRARAFWLRAEDGIRLRAAHWPAATEQLGTVLLFQGRAEYLEKYNAVAQALNEAGYDVLSLDWRGQGLSDRLIDNPHLSHIANFADYQRDVLELVVAAGELSLPRPWHLLAHSMGGAIGYASLLDELPVVSAVFSSPMWGINTAPYPLWSIRGWAKLGRRIGGGSRHCPGSGGDQPMVLHHSFAENNLTGDGLRWGRLVAETDNWPELTLGGVTFDWLDAAIRECDRIRTMPLPAQPCLIAMSPKDKVVSPRAIRARASGWHDGELLEIDGARHEPLIERAPLRRHFLNALIRHFRSVG